MNSTPKFLVGQYVERIMDGLVGKVVRTYEWDGGWAYAVDLGREPMEGFIDDVWSGSEGAWRERRETHAHVSRKSRDCDGDYLHEHIDRMSAVERTEEFGDLTFKERVLGSTVSFNPEYGGTLEVTPQGLTWNEPTDEGYVAIHVEWCDQDDCIDKPVFRDYRAESMGY